ncbi:MAG: matrixin [Parcubacteria group bacterium]|nr:matrixin [Parcubacteria group bacterium]
MKRLPLYLYALALVLAIAAAGRYFYERPLDFNSISFTAPCATPIAYTIGTIDPRFHLTKAELLTKLAAASALWNTAAGKTVLAYLPDDPHAMPVNFVYDARQQTVTLGQKIDSTEASQNGERTQLRSLQQSYLAAQQAYADAIANFNAASEQYAQEVQQSNAGGGADSQTYARLQAEQVRLKGQQTQLQTQGDTLASQAAELKSRIAAFNASVSQINQIVNTFNTSVGGDFEEGQYVEDTSGKRHIDIYAYKNQSELLHSLAHEFGHSLGLSHNENPVSIMFPYNKDGVKLSEDDIAALKVACKLP